MTVGSARSAREPAAEANRGPIQQMFRAIDAADFDALEQVFHPGVVVYERGGYAPTTLTADEGSYEASNDTNGMAANANHSLYLKSE